QDINQHIVLALLYKETCGTFIGTQDGQRPISRDKVTNSDGANTAAQGYSTLQGTELGGLDQELSSYKVPIGGGKAIEPQGFDTAVVLEPTFRYDKGANAFVRIKDGIVFKDNGRGAYVAPGGEEIEPGWKTYVGARNFGRIIHSSLIRRP